MTVDLSLLRPTWKRQRVFGIDCSRIRRQADSMLIGRWNARSMRPPKRFVHSRPISMSRQRRCASRSKRRRLVGRLARRCLRRCDADLSEGRCESRSTVWVGRPLGAGFVGALVQHARTRNAVHARPLKLPPRQILDLLAEDSRPNVYAGELEVRPPLGPNTWEFHFGSRQA
jgi:hypothetical protein